MSRRDGLKRLTPKKAGDIYGKVLVPASPVGRQQRRERGRAIRKQLQREAIEKLRRERKSEQ